MAARVQIGQGTLEGVKDGDVFKFLGIPYAAPPVGELRWRAPQPPSAWDGIRHAKRFGPICPQTTGASFDLRQTEESEDCLYLNIWTRRCDVRAEQPVMLWIHGGGNLGGAGSEDACDGTKFATKGVALVTFNYRLGAFGFLSHPKLGANFGVLDEEDPIGSINH
jgi:para-nitrobenzyl esterase